MRIDVHRLGARGEECLHLGGVEAEPVQAVDRREIDRDRHEHAVDLREHAVLVRSPAGEARQIGGDVRSVGVKDVRPVAVHEDAVVVVVVEGVAADVRPAVDQQHALARAHGETFGQHAAGEAGAHDQAVEPGAADQGGPAGRPCTARPGRRMRAAVRCGGRRAGFGAHRAHAAHRISSRIRA